MTPANRFALTLVIALSIAASTVRPVPGAQLAKGVSSTCSQSHQGTVLYSECYSTIAYMDPRTSEVFYCHGDHQVVTHGLPSANFQSMRNASSPSGLSTVRAITLCWM